MCWSVIFKQELSGGGSENREGRRGCVYKKKTEKENKGKEREKIYEGSVFWCPTEVKAPQQISQGWTLDWSSGERIVGGVASDCRHRDGPQKYMSASSSIFSNSSHHL